MQANDDWRFDLRDQHPVLAVVLIATIIPLAFVAVLSVLTYAP